MAVEPGTAVMRISRAADDRAAAGVYFGAVGTRLVASVDSDPIPVKIDWLVAALLTVVASSRSGSAAELLTISSGVR